jgi:hypothetical protein
MQYKAYPKQAIIAAMKKKELLGADTSTSTKKTSFWDITKWPSWWQSGANELEKSDVGKVITAPISVPAAIVSATKDTVSEVPGVVKSVSKTVPVIAGVVTIIGTGYILNRMGAFDKIKKKINSLKPVK